MLCLHALASVSFQHTRISACITSRAAARGNLSLASESSSGDGRSECEAACAVIAVGAMGVAAAAVSCSNAPSRSEAASWSNAPDSVTDAAAPLGGGAAPPAPRSAGVATCARTPVGSRASKSLRRCRAPTCHALTLCTARSGLGIASGISNIPLGRRG